ncbi:MAG: hypothetical protein GXN94_03895 [Aquificae bacterium]|nr:hypothetical protein [Aquificota bacterium]
MGFEKVKEILTQLTKEHVVYLKQVEEFEKMLEEQFSPQLVQEIMEFIDEKIGEHARVEEEDLDIALQEAGITDFDIDALNFGHRTLDEIVEHLKYLVELYNQGKDTYQGKDLEGEIKKTAKEFFTTLKDHFTEEEHFFFPEILKYDLERFE